MSLTVTTRFLRVASVLALAVAALSGCGGGDAASVVVGNTKDQSIAITRERTFLWSDWSVYLVVSNYPDCARRYPLKSVSSSANFKVEVYRDALGGFVMRQGKRWYVAALEKCQSQQFSEPPPEPGELIGRFVEKDGTFRFRPADKDGGKSGGNGGE